jgi:tetratricopeptide (TPR) repeat protein
VAEDLGSLASIQQDLGFYSDAESLARQALAIDTAYYGDDHPKTAASLTMVGRSMLYQKRYPEAEQALQQALAIEEKDFGPVHTVVADTLNELGNVASLHDDYDTAQSRFQRVADIYRSIYGDHHYLLAIALSNVAYVELNRGKLSDAETGFRDVIRRFNETLGADNVNTGIAHIKLGRTLLRERRFNDAALETRAGYDNLQRQTSPGISYLQAARKDMAAEYKALGQVARATQFQNEFDANAASTQR